MSNTQQGNKEKTKYSVVAEESNSKRQANRSCVEDIICPISLELPWEPVIAGDGQLYDRQYIEEYMERTGGSRVRSPVTNALMSYQLLPAPWMKNHINRLIDGELQTIDTDMVVSWKKRSADEIRKRKWLNEARAGNTGSIEKVAIAFTNGTDGFRKDPFDAHYWCSKGHEAGIEVCSLYLGVNLLHSCSSATDRIQGAGLLARCATAGWSNAAFELGRYFAEGGDSSKREAIFWLRHSMSARCFHTTDFSRELACQMLDKLLEMGPNETTETINGNGTPPENVHNMDMDTIEVYHPVNEEHNVDTVEADMDQLGEEAESAFFLFHHQSQNSHSFVD